MGCTTSCSSHLEHGGLSTEIYQELLAWLTSQKVDIAMAQGTRWREERTWKAQGFSIIQSGKELCKTPTYCGLLTFVPDRICSFDDISYSISIPGPLTHVKCRIGSIELVHVYQHPDATNPNRPRPMEARGELWTKLDQMLHLLPRRNITVVAANFNCPADSHDFLELTKKYFQECTHVRYLSIDHILVPQAKLDAHGRLGRSLPNFPVASWRACRDHLPVICSVPLALSKLCSRPGMTIPTHRPNCKLLL